MAVMWPKLMPSYIQKDPLRSAECKVYENLKENLEEPFVVFYSRPWLGLTPHGEERDGECDFVIAHPDLGFLTIEVKGGAVSYDPILDKWTSRDRWGCLHNIKNPVNQARVSKYHILNKLKKDESMAHRHLRARHGVIFPDSDSPDEDLGADMPLNIFCFCDQFNTNIRGWILDRLGDLTESRSYELPLGKDGLASLENLLAKPFQLHVPLGKILSEDDSSINELTQQQFYILKMIEGNRRIAISGGAGTGKTVLAMEEAIRCNNSGMRVLFTCYNKPLSEEIKHRIGDRNNLIVTTFHELCLQSIKAANLKIPDNIPSEQLFSKLYPELFIESIKTNKDVGYDAIIVDEGQDFLPLWWSAIDSIISDNKKGLLRVFFDSNQHVYNNVPCMPVDINRVSIRLSYNIRNTQRIHELVKVYYKGFEIESIGPEGININWLSVNDKKNMNIEVENLIINLTSQESVQPSDITVLATSDRILKQVAPTGKIARIKCTLCDRQANDSITLDTIRRFKGLENRIVIIIATPDLIIDDELLYVAFSRARVHLIIIGDDDTINKIRN